MCARITHVKVNYDLWYNFKTFYPLDFEFKYQKIVTTTLDTQQQQKVILSLNVVFWPKNIVEEKQQKTRKNFVSNYIGFHKDNNFIINIGQGYKAKKNNG